MRIVDVCAFYTPAGGGVRTYVDAKLRASARFGHEMIVVAPGAREAVERRGPGALLVTIASPTLPVDRRYRYFDDQRALHRVLDAWRPDHVEASSPWSSATMVGRWQGAATRSLVMHADPLASYAYRWLGGIATTATIDRWFAPYWRHLRGLGRMFDAVICANGQLADRLRAGGMCRTRTIAMGVEPGRFSPALRSPLLRAELLRSLGLDPSAALLLGIGRLSGEKRWEMVIRAVHESARDRSVGLLLAGDGPRRQRIELAAGRATHVALAPRLDDRDEVARLVASADALVHGCESETFCLVAAEARASGVPLIVPDRGAALDQLVPGAGLAYRAGRERSLRTAIGHFIDRGVDLQRAVAARACGGRTIDEHFAELFGHYERLAATPAPLAMPLAEIDAMPGAMPQLALARSTHRGR
jgi:alpha-1,6-mannosyltransferase